MKLKALTTFTFSRTTHALLFFLTITLSGCGHKPSGEKTASEKPGQKLANGETSSPVSTQAPPKKIWTLFSGERAFAQVKKLVDLGPHPAGSPKLEAARKIIISELNRAGWDVQRQTFTDKTPVGPVKFVNLIARYAGAPNTPAPADTQRAIVCSHYDTKFFDTIRFVGADDSGSSTGALIELARVLAKDPALARKVELVFFDGEEAIQQWSATDGTYGSRYYAKMLVANGRTKQFKFAILWDMIGQKNLEFTLSPDSPAKLTNGIFKAADALHLRDLFTYFDQNIWDDQVPLTAIKIPAIDLIDFHYPFWHTADDTLDKLSPKSLQITGAVTLYYLHQELRK